MIITRSAWLFYFEAVSTGFTCFYYSSNKDGSVWSHIAHDIKIITFSKQKQLIILVSSLFGLNKHVMSSIWQHAEFNMAASHSCIQTETQFNSVSTTIFYLYLYLEEQRMTFGWMHQMKTKKKMKAVKKI